jgi:hypothetical protein
MILLFESHCLMAGFYPPCPKRPTLQMSFKTAAFSFGHARHYYPMMIASFRDCDTESLLNGHFVKRFAGIAEVARRKLRQLQIAGALPDLRVPPGNDWRRWLGIGKVSIASGLTISSASVFGGQRAARKMWRSWTIAEKWPWRS